MKPDRAAITAGAKPHISPLGWIRIGLRAAGLLLALLVCVPLHYMWRITAYGSPFPKLFLGIAARICGARVKRRGTALRRDVVFLANHVSWIDILALAGASGTAFVAKAELQKAPVVGWLAGLNRTVYVQREARMDVADQINAVREALLDNWSVTIFPEGTTTDGQSLLPFKTSMLKMLEPPPPGVYVHLQHRLWRGRRGDRLDRRRIGLDQCAANTCPARLVPDGAALPRAVRARRPSQGRT